MQTMLANWCVYRKIYLFTFTILLFYILQKKQFARACGRFARERGHNAAYGLVDEVFSRNFFTKVSWSGIQKKGHIQKEAFSQFQFIKEWFFDLVKSIDNNYNEADMDVFFKDKVIGNSNQRAKVQSKRVSRVKCKIGVRPKVRGDKQLNYTAMLTPNSSESILPCIKTEKTGDSDSELSESDLLDALDSVNSDDDEIGGDTEANTMQPYKIE